MLRFLFSPQPLWPGKGLGLVRIVFGLLLAYHGKEVFQPELMSSYLDWEPFKGPNGLLKVYAGKSAELIAGLLLSLGLFTRLGALICVAAMSYITFGMGEGRFWYEEQHPFMFVLFGLLFLFAGPGAWSLDGRRWGG
jgi:putative oxidoreductase